MRFEIVYDTNKATELEIAEHLRACDQEFVWALQERVNLDDYAQKIYSKAVRFEAWAEDVLVGIVAAYRNDQTNSVYITNVSVLNKWQGKGIAGELISRSIRYTKSLGLQCMSLEVARGNAPAICLYEKYGFKLADTGNPILTMVLRTI